MFNKIYKKVIGWGTGKYFEDNVDSVHYNIDYLVDNNSNKWGSAINGLSVFSPNQLLEEDPNDTLVIVFSSFYNEISEDIKNYGFKYFISAYEFKTLTNVLSQNELNNPKVIEEYIDKEKFITISRNNFTMFVSGLSKFIFEQIEIANAIGITHMHFYWKELHIKGFEGVYCYLIIDGKEVSVFELKEFKKILRNIKSVVIHNIVNLSTEILTELLQNEFKNLNIYYYLHDFASICVNIKLAYNDEYFCNGFENKWSLCNSCKYKIQKDLVYNYHQEIFALNNVKIIAPSENVKNAINKSFHKIQNEILVVPHQTYGIDDSFVKFLRNDKKLRIAYVGYKHKLKGWDTFKQMVNDFKGSYDFYCMGSSDEIIPEVQHVSVSFLEDGEVAMTKKLLEHEIDIAFLWSEWPETYAYTYYESVAAGTYIITNNQSGNIRDQVEINQNGIILEDYNKLIEFLKEEEQLKKFIVQNTVKFNNLTKNVEGMSLIF